MTDLASATGFFCQRIKTIMIPARIQGELPESECGDNQVMKKGEQGGQAIGLRACWDMSLKYEKDVPSISVFVTKSMGERTVSTSIAACPEGTGESKKILYSQTRDSRSILGPKWAPKCIRLPSCENTSGRDELRAPTAHDESWPDP